MNLDRADLGRRGLWQGMLMALAFVFLAAPAFAAASLTVKVDQGGQLQVVSVVNTAVGVQSLVQITVKNGKVSQPIPWPKVNGLTLNGTGYNPHTNDYNFFVTPERAGDITVPGFDIRTDDGQILHVEPIKFHVIAR